MAEEDYLCERIRRSLELADKVDDAEVAAHLLQMAADDQRQVDCVLHEPAATQSTAEREVARLTQALEEYLRQTTGMRFDE